MMTVLVDPVQPNKDESRIGPAYVTDQDCGIQWDPDQPICCEQRLIKMSPTPGYKHSYVSLLVAKICPQNVLRLKRMFSG